MLLLSLRFRNILKAMIIVLLPELNNALILFRKYCRFIVM